MDIAECSEMDTETEPAQLGCGRRMKQTRGRPKQQTPLRAVSSVSHAAAASHLGLPTLELKLSTIKWNKFISSIVLDAFEMFSSHVWLAASALDSTWRAHSYCHRKSLLDNAADLHKSLIAQVLYILFNKLLLSLHYLTPITAWWCRHSILLFPFYHWGNWGQECWAAGNTDHPARTRSHSQDEVIQPGWGHTAVPGLGLPASQLRVPQTSPNLETQIMHDLM